MKALGDFLALILFFVAYYITKDMRIATATALVIGVLQAAYTWFKVKHLEPMQWISLILIVVFGGATIITNNGSFIQWKASILLWATALAILISQLLKKNGLKLLMGKEIQLPDAVWNKLAYAWVTFFMLTGSINIWVAKNFTMDQWVTYKTFGFMGLMLLFFICQGLFIYKHLPKEQH
jgi:intracellular septation protein